MPYLSKAFADCDGNTVTLRHRKKFPAAAICKTDNVDLCWSMELSINLDFLGKGPSGNLSKNTYGSLEDKKIWRHTSPIMELNL